MTTQHTRPLWLGFLLTPLFPPLVLSLGFVLQRLFEDPWSITTQIIIDFLTGNFFILMTLGTILSIPFVLLCIPIVYGVLYKNELTYILAMVFGFFFGGAAVLFTGVYLSAFPAGAGMGAISALGFCLLVGVKRVW